MFKHNYSRNMKTFLSAVILSALLFTISCNSKQDSPDERYQTLMEDAVNDYGFNGNVLVIKKGEIVYSGSFGTDGSTKENLLNEETVFRLASVGKQFTAAGIMVLKEKGLLSLDQDFRDFIPELPYKGVSIRHLLNHVSGLPDYVNLMDKHWKPEIEFTDPAKLISGNEDIIAMFALHKPEVRFLPGEKWEYSNTGYVFLASVIERVSGKTFASFMKENVYLPAGMESTLVYDYRVDTAESVENRAYGHYKNDSGKNVSIDFHYVNRAAGDGGTFSTLKDLAAWDRALYTDKVLRQSTLKEAFTSAVLNKGKKTDYGFGWGIKESPDGTMVVEHSGGWAGFSTYFYRDIENKNCLVILTNNSSKAIWKVKEKLLKILYKRNHTADQESDI